MKEISYIMKFNYKTNYKTATNNKFKYNYELVEKPKDLIFKLDENDNMKNNIYLLIKKIIICI